MTCVTCSVTVRSATDDIHHNNDPDNGNLDDYHDSPSAPANPHDHAGSNFEESTGSDSGEDNDSRVPPRVDSASPRVDQAEIDALLAQVNNQPGNNFDHAAVGSRGLVRPRAPTDDEIPMSDGVLPSQTSKRALKRACRESKGKAPVRNPEPVETPVPGPSGYHSADPFLPRAQPQPRTFGSGPRFRLSDPSHIPSHPPAVTVSRFAPNFQYFDPASIHQHTTAFKPNPSAPFKNPASHPVNLGRTADVPASTDVSGGAEETITLTASQLDNRIAAAIAAHTCLNASRTVPSGPAVASQDHLTSVIAPLLAQFASMLQPGNGSTYRDAYGSQGGFFPSPSYSLSAT